MTNQLITYGLPIDYSLISLASSISYVWQLLFQATTIPGIPTSFRLTLPRIQAPTGIPLTNHRHGCRYFSRKLKREVAPFPYRSALM